MAIAAGVYLPIALSSDETARTGCCRRRIKEPTDFVVGRRPAGARAAPARSGRCSTSTARRATAQPRLMPAAAVLVVLGALTLAVVTVLRQLELIDIARQLLPRARGRAARPRGGRRRTTSRTSISRRAPGRQPRRLGRARLRRWIMISLNAMRAGLLSRFMGVLGIFVGVVLVIPLGVQILPALLVRRARPALPRALARRAGPRVGDGRGDPVARGRGAARGDRAAPRRARGCHRARRAVDEAEPRRAGGAAADVAQAPEEALTVRRR